MSIQTEITRLESAKAAIKTAIEGKGVTVPDGTLLDGMAALIESIEAGGSGGTDAEDGIIARTITTYTNNRVQSIGDRAFNGCSELTSVDFPAATTIGNYAFYECKKLTNVNFSAVTTISASAFDSCFSLTSANFPEATAISNSAFNGCRGLTSVNFPAVTIIGSYVFNGCSKLTSIDFPALAAIRDGAFIDCKNLTSVVLRKTDTICTLSANFSFNNTPIKNGTGYIYVPDALVDQYKAATNWSTYAANIKPLSEYTEV